MLGNQTYFYVKWPAGLWDKSTGTGLLNFMFAATCPAQIVFNDSAAVIFSMYWTVPVSLTFNYN